MNLLMETCPELKPLKITQTSQSHLKELLEAPTAEIIPIQ